MLFDNSGPKLEINVEGSLENALKISKLSNSALNKSRAKEKLQKGNQKLF